MRPCLALALLLTAQARLQAQEVAFGLGRLHELGAKAVIFVNGHS